MTRSQCEAEARNGRCSRSGYKAGEIRPVPGSYLWQAPRRPCLCAQHWKQAEGENGVLLPPEGLRWKTPEPK